MPSEPCRTPGVDIRRRLRKEAGFVCAAEGCSTPYLEYHHFDPPWAKGRVHNVGGMIALCKCHHGLADGGHWTKKQLYQMKESARQRRPETIKSNTGGWKRERTVLSFGGGITFLGCEIIVEVAGKPVIWLSKDGNGYELLNMMIRGSDGSIVFEMQKNDWIAHPSFDDFEAPPLGRSLSLAARDKGIRLELLFKDLEFEEAAGRVRLAPEMLSGLLGGEPEMLLCEVHGQLAWPRPMLLGQNRAVLNNGAMFSGAVALFGKVGLSLQ